MAKTVFPLSIDRRRLLTSAAAVTATAIAPDANSAAGPFVQLPQVTSEAGPANFSAGTARRLIEIARRNEIRREANLPLLSIAKELRRMKKQEELEEFDMCLKRRPGHLVLRARGLRHHRRNSDTASD